MSRTDPALPWADADHDVAADIAGLMDCWRDAASRPGDLLVLPQRLADAVGADPGSYIPEG